MNHGRPNTYRYHRCRCPECVAAHNADASSQKARRFARTKEAGGIAPAKAHNAATYTNWGCRCDTCCETERRRHAQWRGTSA